LLNRWAYRARRSWPLADFSIRVSSTSRMGVAAMDNATASVSAFAHSLSSTAGFGRYGQIAGRVLLSSGVKMVILDHDPDHVDTLRKFDMKVFYGDATCSDRHRGHAK
jgi:voltage-gated potassium channel Kch